MWQSQNRSSSLLTLRLHFLLFDVCRVANRRNHPTLDGEKGAEVIDEFARGLTRPELREGPYKQGVLGGVVMCDVMLCPVIWCCFVFCCVSGCCFHFFFFVGHWLCHCYHSWHHHCCFWLTRTFFCNVMFSYDCSKQRWMSSDHTSAQTVPSQETKMKNNPIVLLSFVVCNITSFLAKAFVFNPLQKKEEEK